jgi:cytochrome c oxidase assembly protein subunit 15
MAAMFWLIWRLWSLPDMRSTARWLLALILWQFASGLTNVVLDWPLLAAVGHTGGAAALVVVMTGALFGTRTALNTVRAPTFNTSRPI